MECGETVSERLPVAECGSTSGMSLTSHATVFGVVRTQGVNCRVDPTSMLEGFGCAAIGPLTRACKDTFESESVSANKAVQRVTIYWNRSCVPAPRRAVVLTYIGV